VTTQNTPCRHEGAFALLEASRVASTTIASHHSRWRRRGENSGSRRRRFRSPAVDYAWAPCSSLVPAERRAPTRARRVRVRPERRIARRYLDTSNSRVIGSAGRNPVELMMAFGSLAAGGMLERHPGLRSRL